MVNGRDQIEAGFRAVAGSPSVEWVVAPGLTAYDDAVAEMERLVRTESPCMRRAAAVNTPITAPANGWPM